ncbi:tripartite tricarboxylate transporter substrate-binding protein [Chenggangzhangella methanolivorans]|uniref:Tripartite tricarboxylate transporter substrate binding protein n=1 Tax=Chenggangzhangella methanolivorans TaxID=1437009 RepID=A0A9E6RAC3_9HYPH|nr:tripartite tricarboxylate transporter substrate-binding protein [Chenggangzhangella methanolivorans]QZO00180.1 hypothetical protein K6K41_27230 [Chenggangzhangella methanolivorans]
MTTKTAWGPDRRVVASGLGAAAIAGLAGGSAAAQTVGLEIIAAGQPGDGDDQLARAVAEGFGVTQLLPRAMAIDVPRTPDAAAEFLDGKRPRASLMVLSLSAVGALTIAGAAGRLRQFRPVARLIGERQPIVVRADSPYRTLDDLMAAIARDPAAVRWAGRPLGSADHQLALRLTKAAGADPKRLSYRAADTAARVAFWALKGETPVATGALLEFASQIRGGTLRALALASPDRTPDIDIPTLREQGVDLAMLNWRGLVSRGAVSSALIDRFGEAMLRVSRYPGWLQMLDQRFWANLYDEEDAFERFIAEEAAQVTRLLTEGGAI